MKKATPDGAGNDKPAMRAMCAAICSAGAPAPALPPPRRCLKMTGAAAHARRLIPTERVRRKRGVARTVAQAQRAATGS